MFSGQTILITRAKTQASKISLKLKNLKAHVIEFPTIEIEPVLNFSDFDSALKEISKTDWLIFTSVNAVTCFLNQIQKLSVDKTIFKNLKIAAVGISTKSELEKAGFFVNLIPQNYKAHELIESFKSQNIKNKKAVWFKAQNADIEFSKNLKQLGFDLKEVVLYKTILPEINEALKESIFKNPPDWITFASSSAVINFVKILGIENIKSCLSKSKIAVIGPVTEKSALDAGLSVAVKAYQSTIESLIQSMINFGKSQSNSQQ